MTGGCKDWYYKYDTLQECLNQEENFGDPVDLGVTTTDLATTTVTTTSRPTSGSTTSLTVTVTVESNFDYANIIGEELETDVIPTEFIDDIKEETSGPSQLVPEELETLLKAQVKASVGVDGKVLTAVFSVELVGGAIMTFLLYKGMKAIGGYLWKPPTNTNYENLERSNIPLHGNEAANPEDTIRPTNRDDDTASTYRTANLDSTRVNETRLTNLSSLSPIGEPQWNRTQSNLDLPSTSRPRHISKSPSAPILLDLDSTGLNESLEEPDASDLLGMSILKPATQIVDAIAQSNNAPSNAATANAVTDNASAPTTASATATATTATTADSAITADSANSAIATANNAAATDYASDTDASDNERRYPQRKRTPPKRFGWD